MNPRPSLFFWLIVVGIITVVEFTLFSLFLTSNERYRYPCAGPGHTLSYDSSYGPNFHDSYLSASSLRTYSSPVRANVKPFYIHPIYRELQDKIDSVRPTERCAAFGVQPHNESTPRRIFFGSMLADENMEVIKINAVETHGIYDVMAFVESNTTHMATPRTMRFRNTPEADMLLYSNMFGNQTKIVINYWLENFPGLLAMNREVEQRNTIVKLWKDAGMTERDIGLMADLDEVVSRDFLRALQFCDFPKLRVHEYSQQPSCQTPKMVLSTIQFESSPLCIKKNQWYHPDVILGQCIEGIGDPTERVVPLRTYLRQYGERHSKYGSSDPFNYPKHILESNMFPLFSGRDIRTVAGSSDPLSNYNATPGQGDTAVFGVAYHFHNWFNSLEDVRHKYATYGHGSAEARRVRLSDIEGDLDLMVRCSRDLGNDVNPQGYAYYEHGGGVDTFSATFGGTRPLYFRNETYVQERHAMVLSMVARDEEKYGSRYPSPGKN